MRMLLSAAVIVVGVAGLAALPALAQQAKTETTVGVSKGPTTKYVEFDDLIVQPFNIPVDRVENRTIYAQNGDVLGEIDEVLFGPDQRISAVSVSTGTTGIFGYGGREVVLELRQIELKGVKATVRMSREEFAGLPTYED